MAAFAHNHSRLLREGIACLHVRLLCTFVATSAQLEPGVQIEQSGPALSHQIADAKEQLDALLISDASHLELLSIPPERRSLADEVRICMHDGLAQLKKENEALRISLQVCPYRSDGLFEAL